MPSAIAAIAVQMRAVKTSASRSSKGIIIAVYLLNVVSSTKHGPFEVTFALERER
jgi:hypothetical protein